MKTASDRLCFGLLSEDRSPKFTSGPSDLAFLRFIMKKLDQHGVDVTASQGQHLGLPVRPSVQPMLDAARL